MTESLESPASPEQQSQPAPPRSILLLSGDESTLATLAAVLVREGYTCVCHSHPAEALADLREHPFDSIITDMDLPARPGIEFLEEAMKTCPESIRVILGPPSQKKSAVSALAKGVAQHYMSLPVNEEGLKDLLSEALRRENDIRQEQLAALVNAFRALPSSASAHGSVQRMLAREDNSIKDLVREIEKSPALVAKILHVANSVYYGTRKSITNVHDAVVFIGTGYVVCLVAAIDTFQGLTTGRSPQVARQVDRLWAQALRRATIARMIAEKWPGYSENHLPYIVGLLQDVGQAVRVCSEPEKYGRWLQLCQAKTLTHEEAEEKVFGIRHDRVGAALLEAWNFPEMLINVVAGHHGLAGDDVLTKIIQIADVLESADPRTPHDPAIEPLISEWRGKLHTRLLYEKLYRSEPSQ